MKTVINLYGGPGTGKSTTAAHLFALLKLRGCNAELITEYVKNWVWEGRTIRKNDQYYLFAKQARLESLKFEEVDYIVTDSPVWLSAIYEARHEQEPHICQMLIDKHVDLAKSYGVRHRHIFLNRVKRYSPEGRFQTEDQAKEIDEEILNYLKAQKLEFSECIADEGAAPNILKSLDIPEVI